MLLVDCIAEIERRGLNEVIPMTQNQYNLEGRRESMKKV